jgi:hypothetical protein
LFGLTYSMFSTNISTSPKICFWSVPSPFTIRLAPKFLIFFSLRLQHTMFIFPIG